MTAPTSHDRVFRFSAEESQALNVIYASPEVVAQRQAVLDGLQLHGGEAALDIGCGPGFVVEELARAVGPAGSVAAVDASESAIQLARARCAQYPNVTIGEGEATRLPYEDASFDVAVATQVYEFVANVKLALSELKRVLRPGGRAAIIDTDWRTVLWHSGNLGRMDRVMRAWDEHLAHPTLPRTLGVLLHEAGFAVRARRAIPYLSSDYKQGSYSHGVAQFVWKFVPGRQGITKAEADAWHEELQALADRGAYFFCLNRYLFVAEKL